MAIRKNITSYGAAKGLQATSIADIINLINAFSDKRKEVKDYYDTKTGQEILQLNSGVDGANDLNHIQGIITTLNKNSSNYSTNSANKVASDNVYNKAVDKSRKIKYYREKVNEMQDSYFGTDEMPGFENLTDMPETILTWDYDYLTDELLRIKDFESVFFEDYEQKSPVDYTYNPNKIRTGDLRRRVDAYKNNIYAGLEALKNDGLVSDFELPFIVSGNKAGLVSVKEHYKEFYTKKVKADNTAISAIKKNKAKLKYWLIQEQIKKANSGEDDRYSPIKDSKVAYISSGADFNQQFGAVWEASPDLQDEDKDDYIARMIDETIPENPYDLLVQWTNELIGYETGIKTSEREFEKWMGYKMHVGARDLGKAKVSDFDKQFGVKSGKPWDNRLFPKSIDDLPYDLVSDTKSGHYYSKSKNEYYDRKTLDAFYGIK